MKTCWAVAALVMLPQLADAGGDWAVIRITSHGCSGTVIHAEDGRSLVLTCAHMFLSPARFPGEPDRIDPHLLARSFAFDAPHPQPAKDPRPGIRLLKYDVGSDLALIQVNTRLPYVCPVAVVRPAPGPCASAGYDAMTWPATVRPATVMRIEGLRQFTFERPRGGRSGGPLLAAGGTVVIGVCTGYNGPTDGREVVPGGEGIYSSHAALVRFLGLAAAPPAKAAPLPFQPLPPIPAQPVQAVPVPDAIGRPVQPWERPDPNWRGPLPGAPRVVDRVTPENVCPPGGH